MPHAQLLEQAAAVARAFHVLQNKHPEVFTQYNRTKGMAMGGPTASYAGRTEEEYGTHVLRAQ